MFGLSVLRSLAIGSGTSPSLGRSLTLWYAILASGVIVVYLLTVMWFLITGQIEAGAAFLSAQSMPMMAIISGPIIGSVGTYLGSSFGPKAGQSAPPEVTESDPTEDGFVK